MTNVVSSGGVVIHKGKILVLYKEYKNRYTGWVLPKGKVERGESYEETSVREVKEEASVEAIIKGHIGSSNYKFNGREGLINKTVYWYLMQSNNFYAKPQREEYFVDVGYYKFNEAYHLLRFKDERKILEKAYKQYIKMRKNGEWFN